MIRKIQTSEYLKRYDNMSAEERTAYENRVGEWLRNGAPVLITDKVHGADAGLKNVIVISAGWNDSECQAFEEGALLLSALHSHCETWLPDMLYKKAAGRCIRRMVGLLQDVLSEVSGKQDSGKQEQASDKLQKKATRKNIPVRPTHIDQYVHLLPKKTQERAASYGPLMRELDETREKMRLIVDAVDVSSKDREAVAKRIVAIDKEIAAIRRELDEEWEKLVKQGRVVVDDLGMAHVVSEEGAENSEALPAGEWASGTEYADVDEKVTGLTSEQKARRREIRKWLVDTRRGKGDAREKHVEEWKRNFQEFVGFDGDKAFEDKKVMEAARHYGIEIMKRKATNTYETD